MKAPLETSVENYLVEKVEDVLGGVALKGDVPGRRFLDRIIILPQGVTIYCECKRPTTKKVRGRYSAHQTETLERLKLMRHAAWKVKDRKEIDLLVATLENCRRNQMADCEVQSRVRAFCVSSTMRAELTA